MLAARRAVVVVGFSTLLGGCSFFDGTSGSEDGTYTVAETNTYGEDANLGDVVLRVSDLSEVGNYRPNGETVETRGEDGLSESVLNHHSRSFKTSDPGVPKIVLSEAVVHASTEAGATYLNQIARTVTDEGGERATTSLVNGVDATLLRFTNDRGMHVSVGYALLDNLSMMVTASGDADIEEDLLGSLLITMIADA